MSRYKLVTIVDAMAPSKGEIFLDSLYVDLIISTKVEWSLLPMVSIFLLFKNTTHKPLGRQQQKISFR